MAFVVTATSGHLGRLVVRDLLDRAVPAADIVAGARTLDSITDLAQAGSAAPSSTTTNPPLSSRPSMTVTP